MFIITPLTHNRMLHFLGVFFLPIKPRALCFLSVEMKAAAVVLLDVLRTLTSGSRHSNTPQSRLVCVCVCVCVCLECVCVCVCLECVCVCVWSVCVCVCVCVWSVCVVINAVCGNGSSFRSPVAGFPHTSNKLHANVSLVYFGV